MQLFGIIALLAVLIACGFSEGKKAETQAGYETEQGAALLAADENIDGTLPLIEIAVFLPETFDGAGEERKSIGKLPARKLCRGSDFF